MIVPPSKECINCSRPHNCTKCVIFKQFMKNYTLEDLLQCPMCGTPFVNAYDTILKQVNPHIYRPNCKCYKKEIRISVG